MPACRGARSKRNTCQRYSIWPSEASTTYSFIQMRKPRGALGSNSEMPSSKQSMSELNETAKDDKRFHLAPQRSKWQTPKILTGEHLRQCSTYWTP